MHADAACARSDGGHATCRCCPPSAGVLVARCGFRAALEGRGMMAALMGAVQRLNGGRNEGWLDILRRVTAIAHLPRPQNRRSVASTLQRGVIPTLRAG
jgi:hypothetical protein